MENMNVIDNKSYKSCIEAAQDAIAKVNAMLIAKGKLKPSQLGPGAKKPTSQGNILTKEVEINNVPIGCRNMLTRGATQEEISKMSGAAVATKGRYLTQDERNRNPKERPLYLHVQANNQDSVNLAVGKINEIIANGFARQGPQRISRFSAGGSRGPNPGQRPPQPLMGNQNLSLLQEKLYIGLEHAPPNFNVKDKIVGIAGSFLQHIQGETGAKVTLRGKGSGFIEPTGTEAMEPMHVHLQHVNKMGIMQAKELATNLIQTVQQEYATFQQSFVTVPPPNMFQQPQPMMLPPPPHVVSLAQPPPLLPGQTIITSVPPPTLMQPPPPVLQTSMMPPPGPGGVSASLPAPGVVIPQLASTTAQPPPHPGAMIQQGPPNFSQPSSMSPVQPFTILQSSDIGGQPPPSGAPMFVSAAGQQPPGQVVLTTVGGQQIQHHMPQMQPPPATIQFQQQAPLGQPGTITVQHQGPAMPQPPQGSLPQPPQAILQAPGIQQPQPGLPQQVTIQQQQPVMQQPPNSQFVQQQPAMLPNGMQQVPPGGSMTVIHQTSHPLPPTSPAQQLQPIPLEQQQPPPGQVPVQPGQWAAPPGPGTYTTVQTLPPVQVQQQAPLQHQGQPAPGNVVYSVQQSQPVGDLSMSSSQQPGAVVTSSNMNPVTSTVTNYVYKTGPIEEPRRRFTEEKQDDKLPEGLLGYEHGPPHLTNLMVQPGQQVPVVSTSNQPVSEQTQLPHQQQIFAGQGELQLQQPPQQVIYTQPPGQQHILVAQQPPQLQAPGQPPQGQMGMIPTQGPPPGPHGVPGQIAAQMAGPPGQMPGPPGQMPGPPGQMPCPPGQIPCPPGQPQQTTQILQQPPQPHMQQQLQPPQQLQQPPQQPGQEQPNFRLQQVKIESDGDMPGRQVGSGSPVPGYIQASNGEPGFVQGTGEDQMLMPPPPPPLVGIKRETSALSPQSAPEPRKKSKGFHEEEDDDRDIPSSMSNHNKEMKKYSFNQYSSTPQLYSSGNIQVSSYSQYAVSTGQNGGPPPPMANQGNQPPPGEYGSGYQPEQQSYQPEQQQQPGPGQFQDNRAQQGYIATSNPQQGVYSHSGGTSFTQYNPMPGYTPMTSSPQQTPFTAQPPPPPPMGGHEDGRARSPAGGNVPAPTREELLNQPPPPPPPRPFW